VLIDNNLKPWLLEINHTPSLAPLTKLENSIKTSMLRDLFQLVDVLSEHKLLMAQKVKHAWQCLERYVSLTLLVGCRIAQSNTKLQLPLPPLPLPPRCIAVDVHCSVQSQNGTDIVIRGVNFKHWTKQDLWVCIDAEYEVCTTQHVKRAS
jgi:hypothetical protein